MLRSRVMARFDEQMVKVIHAVNAVLWQPGEQIENIKQTD